MRSKWDYVKAAIDDGRIERWARDGVLEKDMAKSLNIHISTWCRFKHEHKELSEALKKSYAALCNQVENEGLLKAATGYTYVETKEIKEKNEEGEWRTVRKEIYTKHQPPNVAAISFLLKNRGKGQWSDNPQAMELRRKELELKKQIAESTGQLFDMGGDSDGSNTGA